MSTVLELQPSPPITGAVLLRSGDRMDQPTFHERYLQTPDDFRAELIGGIVFLSSPVSKPHANFHGDIVGWLFSYKVFTTGVDLLDNGTVILDDENEPQPDAVLRIDDGCGGTSTTTADNYVGGAPELHVEIAYSSVSIDLHTKLRAYEQCGVREYLVVLAGEQTVRAFRLVDDAYEEQTLTDNSLWKSTVFPGLWLNTPALFERRGTDLLETLQQGLATDEHCQFVERLAAADSSQS